MPRRTFHPPSTIMTVVMLSGLLWTRRSSRPAGAIPVLLCAAFAIGGFVLFGTPATP
ncbi:MAG: hypothetical protein H0T59_10380 [Chloroflexi bacterium]|nr:hypothetical protein [Chloroflexota bacterium]